MAALVVSVAAAEGLTGCRSVDGCGDTQSLCRRRWVAIFSSY